MSTEHNHCNLINVEWAIKNQIYFQKKLEERTQTVDATELKVYGVERTINSTIDLPTTWQSYFMEDGCV